jgi:hypothetical protein
VALQTYAHASAFTLSHLRAHAHRFCAPVLVH